MFGGEIHRRIKIDIPADRIAELSGLIVKR